jgi:Na+-translocating ferredoxin:NAD+ oxidoreductase RnfG subunit
MKQIILTVLLTLLSVGILGLLITMINAFISEKIRGIKDEIVGKIKESIYEKEEKLNSDMDAILKKLNKIESTLSDQNDDLDLYIKLVEINSKHVDELIEINRERALR